MTPVFRHFTSLDPQIMVENSRAAFKMYGHVFSALQEAKWLNDRSCDLARQELEGFRVSELKTQKKFNWDRDQLKSFFMDCITPNPAIPSCGSKFSYAWSFFMVNLVSWN